MSNPMTVDPNKFKIEVLFGVLFVTRGVEMRHDFSGLHFHVDNMRVRITFVDWSV